MPEFSRRTKEAIKTALAMTAVIGIALWLPLDRPYWAGFAVAMISLDSAGASINKGLQRMAGTLFAFVATLALFALFMQDRWSFMAASSLFVGWLIYMMGGKKFSYFFMVSAFVTLVISIDAGHTPGGVFLTAVARVEETALGVLVYSLISLLLWPVRSGESLQAVRHQLVTTQVALLGALKSRLLGEDDDRDPEQLRAEALKLLAKLPPALDAAVTDTPQVHRQRSEWRLYQQLTIRVQECIERLRADAVLIDDGRLCRVLPGLPAFLAALANRFEAIGRETGDVPDDEAGAAPASGVPSALALEPDPTAIAEVSVMERSAAALTRTQLLELDEISRSLLGCTRRLGGHEPPASDALPTRPAAAPRRFHLDPERLSVAAMVMAAQWASFLLWVYVDTPGHQAMVQLVPTLAMVLGPMAFVRPSVLIQPFLMGGSIMGFVYVFIMPRLTGFFELGTMIFLLIFGIGVLYGSPAKALMRLGAFICFLSLLGINNEQAYSFAGFANSLLMIFLAVGLVSLIASFRFSRRPEQALRRVLMRFSREGLRTLEGLRRSWSGSARKPPPGTTPLRDCALGLQTWSQHVAATVGVEPARLQTLASTAGSLSFRMEALVNTDRAAAPAGVKGRLQQWHVSMEELLQGYGVGQLDAPAAGLRSRLDRDLVEFEDQLEQLEADAVPEHDRLPLYQLLGSYRSLAEGMVSFAEAVDDIPWDRMREPRF